VINTNLSPILHRFQVWLITGQIFASDMGLLHFNALAGVIPADIAISDIYLTLDSFGYIFVAENIDVFSHFYVMGPEGY